MATPQSGASGSKQKDAKWTVRDARVNLTALLNDPRKSRRDYDLFTKTWGEAFRDLPSGSTIRRSKYVPNVVQGHFQEYMESTGDRLLRHNSRLLSNRNDENAVEEQLPSVADGRTGGGQNKVVIQSAVVAQRQRDAMLKTRMALEALPKIFLKTDFAMDNPSIFSSTLNFGETKKNPSSAESSTPLEVVAKRKEAFSSKLLQEKLSHYLDMVEIAIVRQISLRSDTFFRAMTSHDELHEHLNVMLTNVQSLLAKVKLVDHDIVRNALQVVNLRRAHLNSMSLLERLRMVVTVHQTQPTIQLLLSSNEYAGSLDLIRTTQEVLHQELAGLHCFRHLSSQLSEMERVIGHMMRQEINECLTREIQRPLDEGHACTEPHRITAVTYGLLRQGQFDFLDNLREETEVAVKSTIKELVAGAVEKLPQRAEEEDGKTESLAAKMRMLHFDDWILLLNQIFDHLLVLLRRVKSILDVIAAVASDSVARGDIIKVPRDVRVLGTHRRTPTKALSTKEQEGADLKNPFMDSDSTADEKNPFLADSPAKRSSDDARNPFLNDSPGRGRRKQSPERSRTTQRNGETANTNPFLDDLNEFASDNAMYGLASYEDELITNAADSYTAPEPPPATDEFEDGDVSEAEQPDASEQTSSSLQSESDTTTSYGGEVMTREEQDNLTRALRDLLCWTCDFEQDRCVKVLIAKRKDSSLDRLSSSDFLLLAKSVKRFTNEAEAIVRRHSGGGTFNGESGDHQQRSSHDYSLSGSLKGALKTQAGRFVARFHEERRNKLSLILDNEIWKQAGVPAELSQLLQSMVDGRLSQGSNGVETELTNHRSAPDNDSANQKVKASEFLLIDGEKYAVVGTVLILLKMVSEYCKCSDDLPTSAPDLVARLHNLLTLFNSRTCQLVLGAGALQLVGLKTITTKNLALASRCLQLVLHCLPSIRSHFEAKLMQHGHLQAKDRPLGVDGKVTLPHKHLGVLRHFDHVTRDYQDHVTEIENKFVSIVGMVFERHLDKWEAKAPMPSPAFRNICKQVGKFHETVSSLLPEEQTRRILLKVTDDLKRRMRSLLQRYGVRNDGGPKQGLVTSDLAFYETNILLTNSSEGIVMQQYIMMTKAERRVADPHQ